MTLKPVIKMGNPKLSTPSSPILEFSTPALYELITDMQETMKAKNGVGIAAPQIGCNLRVVMFGFDKNARYPNEKSVPFTILINPVITALTEEMVGAWEGCLSVPGLRGFVPRYQKIHYQGFDPEGRPISQVATGFHARVVQHECDHIDGILYPQRIQDLRLFGFEDELILGEFTVPPKNL